MPLELAAPWALGPDYPRWVDRLADDTCVLVRPVRVDDAERERAFLERLSPRSRRARFLGQVGTPDAALLARLTDIDYVHDVAFAAVLADDPDEAFLGVGRYAATADRTTCECAVAVRDDWRERGLGTDLMRHLIDVAHASGFTHMVSIDACDNVEMAALAHDLGFAREPDPDDARQVIHRLALV